MNNDMLPIGITVHINPEDIKWECNGGDLISRKVIKRLIGDKSIPIKFEEGTRGNWQNSSGLLLSDIYKLIDNAPTVELDESVIQEVLNKRCMTAVANDYLVALHGDRPKGEWARHDIWVGGEYVGGFYHVNCPIEDGYYSKWRTNFCPNCGLPMKKGGAE